MRYEIYVDGSFLEDSVGFGYVVLLEGQLIREVCGPVKPEDAQDMRNVAGEIVGVGHALRWCLQNSIPEVHVYYDYEGIRSWALGIWKANKNLTQRYRDFMQTLPVRVHFHKVKAHSGDKWNERADELAKQGAKGGAAPANPSKKNAPKPTAAKPKATQADHALAHLEQMATRAGARLNKALSYLGYRAESFGWKNQMFLRLHILAGPDELQGYADIYNTAQKPLKLHLHGFRSPEAQMRVQAVWEKLQAEA
jgi:ribonuclease HI